MTLDLNAHTGEPVYMGREGLKSVLPHFSKVSRMINERGLRLLGLTEVMPIRRLLGVICQMRRFALIIFMVFPI